MQSLLLIAAFAAPHAAGRTGFDYSPFNKGDFLETLNTDTDSIDAQLQFSPTAIRPYIGWEWPIGRLELRGDFNWDQADNWVEADHIHSHFGILRLRLDYQKRFSPQKELGPLLGIGMVLHRGFANYESDSMNSDEAVNAMALTEEIKSELNKVGLVGSLGTEWQVKENFYFGFRWDMIALINEKDGEAEGKTRRVTIENDAVVTCGWKM